MIEVLETLEAGVVTTRPPVPVTPADGVYYGLEADDYHAVEAMSSSGAKKILRSPQHYHLMRTTRSKPTQAMDFGTAVHCGVLEPECLAERVIIIPDINRYTKAGKAEWAAFQGANVGKILLTESDMQRAVHCIDAVLAHPAASRLLDGSTREVTLFWRDKRFDVPCKARLDGLNHGGILDLKTCQDASAAEFSRAVATYKYHLQACFYVNGCEDVLDATPEFFIFIAVESEPPHGISVYQLGRESMMAGARLVDEALARYRDALAAGKWSGYPDTIATINAPRWALRFEP